MNARLSSDDGNKATVCPNRRRFLESAVGAGVALGAAAGTAAFGQAPGKADTVRVGVIGTDGHTGVILGSIPRLPGVELTAFAKSRPDDDISGLKRNKAFTAKTRVFDQFERMLEEVELD